MYISKKKQNIKILFILCLSLIVIFIPLISTIFDAFKIHEEEMMNIIGSKTGDFTLHHLKSVFNFKLNRELFFEPLFNTIKIAIFSFLIAIIIGNTITFILNRTSLKKRELLLSLLSISFFLPSWLIALSWINIFGNKTYSGISGILYEFTNIYLPESFAYGLFPIVVIIGFHFSTIIAFSQYTFQQKKNVTNKKVYFYYFVIICFVAFNSFGTPLFLGNPVRYKTVTTQIYKTLIGLKPGYGYIMTVFILIMGLLFLKINNKLMSKMNKHTQIEIKHKEIKINNLYFYISSFILILYICLPLISFLYYSIQINSVETNLDYIFKSLFNTIFTALLISFFTGIIAIIIGYLVSFYKNILTTILLKIMRIPIFIPSIVLSISFLSFFSNFNYFSNSTPLYYAVIILLGVIKYIPFSLFFSILIYSKIPKEKIEACKIYHLNWRIILTKIIIPNNKNKLIVCFMVPLFLFVRDFSLFIIISLKYKTLLSVQIFQQFIMDWNYVGNFIALLIYLLLIISIIVAKTFKVNLKNIITGYIYEIY